VSAGEHVTGLRYRGHGWPGRFTVDRADGSSVSASYEKSWGESLGPAVQWRCKICADGVGESADVTAADLWRADARGYPDFTDAAGVSALIARTRRGLDLVVRAVDAGIIAVHPIDIDELAAVQPLQRRRRETLAGRLVGTVLAGGRVPRYRGFSLLRLAFSRLRETVRVARRSYRRRRGFGNADG
jgi:coenzyme F420 hydrogenase subunit beta